MVSDISMNSALVTWTIPTLTEQQTYYVQYGPSPLSLTFTSDTVISDSLLPGQSYSVTLNGLDAGTVYYVKVVATFSDITLYSSIEMFTTIAIRKYERCKNIVCYYALFLTYSSRFASTKFQCHDSWS